MWVKGSLQGRWPAVTVRASKSDPTSISPSIFNRSGSQNPIVVIAHIPLL